MTRIKKEDAEAAELARQIEIIDLSDDDEPRQFYLSGIDDDEDEIECLGEVKSAFKRESTSIPPNSISRDCTQVQGESLTAGMVVELQDGDFLRIVHINASSRDVYLRGNLLRRSKFVKGMLDKKLNEVCLIMQTEYCESAGDAKPEQCLTTRRIEDIVRIRQAILTNQPFPAYTWRETLELYGLSWEEVRQFVTEECQLVCRWRRTQEVDRNGKIIAESLMKLKEKECDANHRGSDVLSMRGYGRGDKDQDKGQGGQSAGDTSADSTESGKRSIDLTADKSKPSKKRSLQAMSTPEDVIDLISESEDDSEVEIVEHTVRETIRISGSHGRKERRMSTTYTERVQAGRQPSIKTAFANKKSRGPLPQTRKELGNTRYRFKYGDLCTGAGGMASGASQAGLNAAFLLDYWQDACDTLKLNFSGSKILQEDIFSFCTSTLVRNYTVVDVLHVSFPCQPHSPAHTKPGQNDAANIATGYSVGPILEKCRPRIVTFEQTSGMLTHNDKVHFHALIRQITDTGYSVRWKICNLAEYGNTQPRRRLIILASCPGEELPRFPETTHGAGFGKQRFPTIADALKRAYSVPTPDNMRYYYPHNKESYNPNQPLRSAITCSGGAGNNHPSGKRTFNNFELAQLQSFPLTHKFAGAPGSIKKQIGNAVPSIFAKTLFSHIAKSLEQSDRKVAQYEPETVVLDF